MSSLTRQDVLNFSHIEAVEVFFGIMLTGYFGNKEVFGFQIVYIEFAAFHHQSGLLKKYISTFSGHRSKSGLGRLIMIPART